MNGFAKLGVAAIVAVIVSSCSPTTPGSQPGNPPAASPVAPGQTPERIVFVRTNVSGRLLWGTAPVAGAKIELRRPDWRSADASPVASAIADASGQYTIKDPPAGDFSLVALWPDGTLSMGSTPPVTIISGQDITGMDLHLEKELVLVAPTSGSQVGPTPMLHWQALPEARSYRVLVIDAGTTEMMLDVPTQETSLQVQRSLPGGHTYEWIVTALGEGEAALAHLNGQFVVSADGKSSPDPMAPPMPARQCSGTHYADPANGYCFQYPDRFQFKASSDGGWGIYGPALDTSADPLKASLGMEVQPANGQTLAQVVEAYAKEHSAAGLNTQRTETTLGGEPAVMLEPLAGRPTFRAVLALHAGKVFILRFSPDAQTWPQAKNDVTELYQAVVGSFTFLPVALPALSQVDSDGVKFAYDLSLGTGVTVEKVAGRTLQDTQGGPDAQAPYTAFTFADSYAGGQKSMHQPQIRLYAVADFQDPSRYPGLAQVQALQKLLAGRPQLAGGMLPLTPKVDGLMYPDGARSAEIPAIPPTNDRQVFRAHISYLDFQNGSGIAFLVQYGNGLAPINNAALYYAFQGLTKDGKTVVTGIFPLQVPGLPDSADGADLGALAQNWPAYVAETAKTLDGLPAGQFRPSLDLFDAVLRSLQVQ